MGAQAENVQAGALLGGLRRVLEPLPDVDVEDVPAARLPNLLARGLDGGLVADLLLGAREDDEADRVVVLALRELPDGAGEVVLQPGDAAAGEVRRGLEVPVARGLLRVLFEL